MAIQSEPAEKTDQEKLKMNGSKCNAKKVWVRGKYNC